MSERDLALGSIRIHEFIRNGQTLWVEESGSPSGIPVIYLHGGPGSGCKTQHRNFFDPRRFRILLHDQRGCGHSAQGSVLTQNTTQAILEDLLHIQNALKIPSWILFGGSWGATLALLYSEAWPERVAGMVLRGTFLARQEDLDWFIGPKGVRRHYPEAWAAISEFACLSEVSEVVGSLHAGIHSKDVVTQWRMASAWEQWGAIVTLGDPSRERLSLTDERAEKIIQQSQIELHYAHNHYFIRENQILEEIGRVSEIPAVIIHGQKDLVCPSTAASQLHQLMPLSRLCMLENSAHIPGDDAMIAALVRATEEIADIGFNGR